MAYADLLNETGIQESYLINLQPKVRVEGFSVFSGTVYVADFDYSNFIASVSVQGSALTEGSSTSLAAGEYFYDSDDSKLYIRTAASGDPTGLVVTVSFEIFVSTVDTKFHKDPTDDSTPIVFWEGSISQEPDLEETMSDSLFGFLPVQTTSIKIVNPHQELNRFLYDVSYSKASAKIYHVLMDSQSFARSPSLDTSNVKLILNGVCGDVTFDENNITISVLSRIDQLDNEYRNADGVDSFVTADEFPDLDPNSEGAPVRYVYGRVAGFVPVNIDFPADPSNPTTSENRDWLVVGEQTSQPDVLATVVTGGTTTITLASASGLFPGDLVRVNKASDEYAEIATVDYGTNVITLVDALSVAPVASDTVDRVWIGRVEIEQDGARYRLFPYRDYNTVNFANGTAGFTLTTSAEANAGIPNTIKPSDVIFCTVYGRLNDLSGIGGDDPKTGNLASGYAIIYDLLLNRLGLDVSELDTTTFDTLASADTEPLGIAIPRNSSDTFPTYKTLLNEILLTKLFRLLNDSDGKWTVKELQPGVSASDTITDKEILVNSFKYDFRYTELLSTVRVTFNQTEVSETLGEFDSDGSVVIAESDTARYLHGVNKTGDYNSYHIIEADAQTLADRLSYIFGDQIGRLSVKIGTKEFFEKEIGDVSTFSRTSMPGFSFDDQVLRTRNFTLIDSQKNLDDIEFTFDDQKGIEDNSSNW